MTYPVRTRPQEFLDWLGGYLQNHRAHQFTINGFTYPFVREMHFGSVPYPDGPRKYSMLAGLSITRPGDLFFMFQSDPQTLNSPIESRRGLRGVYRIASEPFSDPKSITASTGYELLGRCPSCGTLHANLSEICVECKHQYPPSNLMKADGEIYHKLNMSIRFELEPLVVFERAISDERTYADMTEPPIIWIGRHDNQMGAGKGSSIRQLLPEEAMKLVRLMFSEPGQYWTFPARRPYPNSKMPILNKDGTPASHLEVRRLRKSTYIVSKELMLNFDVARTFDAPGSSIQTALGNHFTPSDVEYVSTEFPWGYTAGTADFVMTLAKDRQRYRIFVIEFKKDLAGDDAVIQVSLYVPWVAQVLTQFAVPSINSIEVIPVFIGRMLQRDTCVPRPYSYNAYFVSRASLTVNVAAPDFIEYEPLKIYTNTNGTVYAEEVRYTNNSRDLLLQRQIDWRPPKGVVTSKIERDWVKATSWAQARRDAGF